MCLTKVDKGFSVARSLTFTHVLWMRTFIWFYLDFDKSI